MSAVHAIANVQVALTILKEKIAPWLWCETPLPVIAAPKWWLDEVAVELGVEEGLEPASIHGCDIVRNDKISEPVLIDHDGTTYPIIPSWARAKADAA